MQFKALEDQLSLERTINEKLMRGSTIIMPILPGDEEIQELVSV
jgi:hypothetical protein